MVEDRLRKIAKDVARGGQYTGHATANGAMRALRVLYNFAADRAPASNPMPPNPVKLKKVWLEVQPRTRHLSGDELPKFYEGVCALENHVVAAGGLVTPEGRPAEVGPEQLDGQVADAGARIELARSHPLRDLLGQLPGLAGHRRGR